ncbi:MAG: hypothetical protein IID17_14660, partial [Nitrospinae bacterium]|nr:hypothetical protein [Nitrospinota bacterium]
SGIGRAFSTTFPVSGHDGAGLRGPISPQFGKPGQVLRPGTIRVYRDLLGMRRVAGIGHEGFRHFLFQTGDSLIAFFHYEGARPMVYNKFHGAPTAKPQGN